MKPFSITHRICIAVVCLLLNASFALRAQDSGFVSSEGVQTFYRTFGAKGLPILIINGGPGMNSNGFAEVAQKLSGDGTYRTIIYDQRGTGKSVLTTFDASTITMKLMVGDIESLRKHLGFEKWCILGHSFGGVLAAYYATLHPERVDKLILSSTGGINLDFLNYVGARISARLTQRERDSLAYWSERISRGDTSHHARLQRGLALAPAYLYNRTYIPTVAERLTQGNSIINGLVFQNLRAIQFDCAEQLRHFQRPTLIIQGKEDIITVETAEYAHKILPNSRLVLLEKCAHYGWLDKEAEYFTAVRQFLRGE